VNLFFWIIVWALRTMTKKKKGNTMLTKADDYPIHQTPEPIAYSGTDRNFYDRYFFNGYNADGSVYFALAFGVYPHLNIMDAAFSVIVGDTQHALHASKVMHSERLDMTVGPITVEIVEPLHKLRILIKDDENDIHADLLFTGRCAPIEEPRFQYRQGPRMFMDYTRLTQNGSWEGSLSVKGAKVDIDATVVGTRDRSWGIRPVGIGDAQPMAPAQDPQFYWVWVPINFGDRTSFYHINADGDGKPWNESAVIAPLTEIAPGASPAKMANCRSELDFKKGTRHATDARVFMTDQDGEEWRIDLKIQKNFYMKGMGYTHPEWGHGHYKGECETFYETYDLAALDETAFDCLHVQALSTAVLTMPNGETREGRGIVEQLIIGRHAPSGFKELLDGAQ
jgi:hypothetical protein